MTHDPLCPIGQACTIGSRDGYHVLYEVREGLTACDCCDRTCCCDIIAKVRAEEKERAGQRVRSMRGADIGVLRIAAAVAAGDVDAGVGW